jgi:N-acetylneuraminic acid mutarotase
MKKFLPLIFFLAPCSPLLTPLSSAQGVWTQKANFGGTARQYGTAFSIGTKGYVTCGLNCTSPTCYFNDLWEWDQSGNTWTQKANFPGTARRALVGFSIGTKGYASCGYDLNGNYQQDVWEWDQATNTWLQKTNFPGTPREDATAFSVGSKGYIGCGKSPGPKIDWYEFDPLADTWTQKQNFPSTGKYAAVGFAIGSKGYHCTGFQGGPSPYQDELWEFDPAADTWTQKASLAGDTRIYATGFSIGAKGYVGTGYNSPTYGGQGVYNDFWEWDQATNTWSQQATIPASARAYAMGFSIGTKGYICMGGNAPNQSGTFNDLWEWGPAITSISEPSGEFSVSVFPNPMSESATLQIMNPGELPMKNIMLSIYDMNGRKAKTEIIHNSALPAGPTGSFVIRRDNLRAGTYFYTVNGAAKTLAAGKLVIR